MVWQLQHTHYGVWELINVVGVRLWPFLVEPPAALCVCVCVPSLPLQGVGAPEESQQLVFDGGVEADIEPVQPAGLQLAVQNHHVHLIGREGEVAVDAHDSAPRPVGGPAAGAALCCHGNPVHLNREGGLEFIICQTSFMCNFSKSSLSDQTS